MFTPFAFIKEKEVASGLLLDQVPTAAVGFSLRKLRIEYTGNCIEVRRSSDDTTQNIGFINNVLDTASLLTFVGANNGFVKTWYDQSGNGRNATQTDNNLQPQIVNAGTVIVENTKPTISFISPASGDSGLGGLSFSDFSASAVEGFLVIKAKNDPPATDKSSGGILLGSASGGGSDTHYPYTDGNIYDSFGTTARKTVGNPATSLAQLNLYNPLSISGGWSTRLNTVQIFSTGTNTVGINVTPKIGSNQNLYGFNAFLSELVIYPADKTSDRTTDSQFLFPPAV